MKIKNWIRAFALWPLFRRSEPRALGAVRYDMHPMHRRQWCRMNGLGPEWTIIQFHELPQPLRAYYFETPPNTPVCHAETKPQPKQPAP